MKKYVLVGSGYRGTIAYAMPLCKDYRDVATLAGVYDKNPKRAAHLSDYTETPVPAFDDFDKMLREVKPDTVIVTSPDYSHDMYIVPALLAGCDVISEKPLTTTFEKAKAIDEAQKKSGKSLTVTFNLRFHPLFIRAKELVSSGIIGDILSIHYEWMLDTSHGADYFRRWHRRRENSGSLLIHKSTHHFDIANWLLEQDPVAVNAFGTRRFYGATNAAHGERCSTCPQKDMCRFYFDLEQYPFHEIYTKCEDVDHYYRDSCLFSDEVNIEDSVSLNVRYSGGTVMSYSLNAYAPYEGLHLVLNGTRGRMEIGRTETGSTTYNVEATDLISVYDINGKKTVYTIDQLMTSDHGGSDVQIRDMLFRGMDADPLGQKADFRAGIMSAAIGMSANISMAENRCVSVSEFFK